MIVSVAKHGLRPVALPTHGRPEWHRPAVVGPDGAIVREQALAAASALGTELDPAAMVGLGGTVGDSVVVGK